MAADEQPSNDHQMKAAGAPNGDEDRTPAQDPGRPPVSRRHVVRTGLAALSGAAAASIPGLASGGPRSGTSADPRRLVLRKRDLGPRIRKLFEALAKEEKTRAAYVKDPCSTVLRTLFPREYAKISRPRIANANRFLYTVLSNDAFRDWAGTYQRKLARTRRVDRGQMLHDLAVAMTKHAGPAFFKAMLEEQAAKAQVSARDASTDLPDPAIILTYEVEVLSKYAIVTFEDQTTELRKLKNVIPPAQMRAISQQLISRAKQLRKSGKLIRSIITVH